MRNKKKILKYSIRIHLYSGLFASAFLILAGFTAINFQHDILSTSPRDTLYHVRSVYLPKDSAPELSQSIVGQLNISGHTPQWDYRFDKNRRLTQFKIHRPARLYVVDIDYPASQVKVAQIRYKPGAVLEIMHKTTMIDLPDKVLVGWAIFGQLAAASAFLTAIISLYFWISKSFTSHWQWISAASIAIFILIYVLYLWLKG